MEDIKNYIDLYLKESCKKLNQKKYEDSIKFADQAL